jgi:hypothetical protein
MGLGSAASCGVLIVDLLERTLSDGPALKR